MLDDWLCFAGVVFVIVLVVCRVLVWWGGQ